MLPMGHQSVLWCFGLFVSSSVSIQGLLVVPDLGEDGSTFFARVSRDCLLAESLSFLPYIWERSIM